MRTSVASRGSAPSPRSARAVASGRWRRAYGRSPDEERLIACGGWATRGRRVRARPPGKETRHESDSDNRAHPRDRRIARCIWDGSRKGIEPIPRGYERPPDLSPAPGVPSLRGEAPRIGPGSDHSFALDARAARPDDRGDRRREAGRPKLAIGCTHRRSSISMAKTYKRNLGTRLINSLFRLLTRLGLGASYRHILTVSGRKTGRPYSTPVDVIEVDNERWLVAGYGPASWVKNVRAAGEVTLSRGRNSRRFAVEEVGTRRKTACLGNSSATSWSGESGVASK